MYKYKYVYPPSEDSELLLEATLKEVKKEDVVLEVGTGSGFVAERIAEKCKLLVASDISKSAVIAAKSKSKSEKGNRFEVVRADLCKGFKREFTLVLFNPPYLELEDFERSVKDGALIAIDGGKGGIEVVCKFIEELDYVLKDEGRAIIIVSSLSDLGGVIKKAEEKKFRWKVVGRRRLFFEKLYAVKLQVLYN